MMVLLFLIAGLVSFLLARWRPMYGLGLVILFLPWYWIRASLFGIPFTLLEWVLLGFVVAVFIRQVSGFRFQVSARILKPRSILSWLVLLWVLAGTTAIFVSPDLMGALGSWRAFIIEPVLFGWAVRRVLQPTTYNLQPRVIVWCMIALTAYQTGIAFLQRLGIWYLPIPWDDPLGPKGIRVTGSFPHPTMIGLLLAPLVVFLVIIAYQKCWPRALRWSAGITAAFTLVAILLSKTMGAILGITIAAIVWAFLRPRARRLILPVCAGIILFALIVPSAFERTWNYATANGYTAATRRIQWSEATEFLRDHPLTGAGLRGWPIAIRPYHTTGIEIFPHPHNIFLALWVELGLGGFIITLALLAYVFFHRVGHAPQVWPAQLALVTMLGHGLVDVPFFKNDLVLLAAFFVALAVTGAGQKSNIYNTVQ